MNRRCLMPCSTSTSRLDFTAHPEAGYDLIVAVNVLHDASHVVQTLRRLKLLLKAGGRLLIVEATERNSVFQLASVGFIEGLSGYRDFRRRDEKPMLTRSAWQEVLVHGPGLQTSWRGPRRNRRRCASICW